MAPPRDRRTSRPREPLSSSEASAVAMKSRGASAVPDTPPVMSGHALQQHQRGGGGTRWRECAAVLGAVAVVVLVVTHALLNVGDDLGDLADPVARLRAATDEKAALLSKKTPEEAQAEQDIKAAGGADADGSPWSSEMLQWQRTGYHFQPDGNFMNAPMYYRGLYHFFYQYNPKGVVWNKIAWGHAVSSDLVHWRHLPVAMVPDQWYDINGVLTGSATMLPNGTVILLYTGNSDTFAQVQCLAFPADPQDPLLRTWSKHPANPVIYPPPGIGDRDFRDPMAAWFDKSDSTWRTIIGSKDDHGHAGIALMYKTKDFIKYELIQDPVHRVEGTGMWECIDLYPISGGSNSSEEVIHVMKASVNDEWHDYYALGRFDVEANRWTPLDPETDVGIGMRVDWGKFYASTSFYDPVKQRRVSWGFVGETDSPNTDIAKGWASLQGIPRKVVLDEKTRTNILQWPVEEIDSLRYNATNFSGITIESSAVITLPLRQVAQLDIEASFRLNASAIAALNEADVSYNCSTSGGATERGALGPFGLLIHATNSGSEQLAVYFYIYKGLDGGLRTQFCHDESGSSRAKELLKRVVGSTVPVLHGEALSARVLVDHSIVESFVMGGRMTVTSRVYPMEAIHAAGRVCVFNNATGSAVTVEKLVVHEMASAPIQPYRDA
ncbi:hypothetical protein ACQJBY_072514 [Aegilops geniculata]